jgi:hypothetical protein
MKHCVYFFYHGAFSLVVELKLLFEFRRVVMQLDLEDFEVAQPFCLLLENKEPKIRNQLAERRIMCVCWLQKEKKLFSCRL